MASFDWSRILTNSLNSTSGRRETNKTLSSKKLIGLYFSASWVKEDTHKCNILSFLHNVYTCSALAVHEPQRPSRISTKKQTR